MKKITKEELLKTAKISHISIEKSEIEELMNNIASVLDYVSSLQKVVKKADKSEPVELIKTINVVRKDTPKEYASKILLEAAPQQEENYFVVPIIIKH